MKKILKFMMYGIGAIVILSIGIAMAGGGETEPTTAEPTETKAEVKPKEEKKVDPVNKENFEKIVQGDSLTGAGGMSIEEVVAILGEPDQTMESQSGDTKMEDYSWIGADFQTISVNFTNGKVSFKMFME